MSTSPSSQLVHYRLARPVMARFVGGLVMAVAILVFVTTFLVSVFQAGLWWIIAVAALGVVAVIVAGWWLRSKAYVLRCSSQGYSVRFVRGAGVREARWTDVESAVTTSSRGIPCLVLKLADGGTTTIPVSILEVDRERLVREIQAFLGRPGKKPGKKAGKKPGHGPAQR